jgi:prevent-host-death family protein
MGTRSVDVEEAKEHLSELLSLVREGIEIVLTESDAPLARLVPIATSRSPRVPGLHAGAVRTTDDFDEPLPQEFWTAP